jgi:hypothetical protein
MNNKILLVLLFTIFLAACAENPVKKYYEPAETAKMSTNESCAMPNIYIYSNVSDLDKAIAELMVDGYIDIGISSFYGVDRDNLNSQIKEQSQLIKACKIVVYSSYRNTMSGNYALQTPRIQSSTSPISGNVGSTQFYGTINTTTYGTNTSYVPYSYEVYNNTVYFMNKATGYRTGMIVQNLTDSLKQSINSNKGVCRNCSR